MSKTFSRTILTLASPVLIGSGAAAWAMITQQLKAEEITVPGDATRLAGKPVAGPVSAFMQAETVAKHAQHIGGGRTFADVTGEYMAAQANGDTEKVAELEGPRALLKQAGFTRASLMTSVLAYGVSALVMGMGVVTAATASALRDEN